MIKAGIVGLGWWGKTLVESAENSDVIRFVSGTTRTMTPEIEAFAKKKGFRLTESYDGLLHHGGVDAVVLARSRSRSPSAKPKMPSPRCARPASRSRSAITAASIRK